MFSFSLAIEVPSAGIFQSFAINMSKFLAKIPLPSLIFQCMKCSVNAIGVRGLKSKQLFCQEFGEPSEVVKCKEVEISQPKDDEVLVQMIAAPVNPADINTIQGKYGVKVSLPMIPGNEGYGEILETGSKVSKLKRGDRVIILKPTNGSWRTLGLFKSKVLRKVPRELGIVEAATLAVNSCSAYRLLLDYKPVREKKLVVIQNAANSTCGQSVIQLCKNWNVPNVNIVRNRPNIDDLKSYLQELGATYVLTEEELRTTRIFKDNVVDKPSLALNCVGGKSSSSLARQLKSGGVIVTYGGMSRESVIIPTAPAIFKELSFYGFWMTAWNERASIDARETMFNELVELQLQGKLRSIAHKLVKLDNYREALENAMSKEGMSGCKYILDFS